MENLDKNYNPKNFEDRLYKLWEDKGYFTPEIDRDKEPFTIMMPPPNVTGNLHLGHAMNNTIQDILIRWKRMSGYSALWLPGTDHASISTEARVVKKIESEGKTKEGLGREAFLDEAWLWTEKYGGNIKNQLRKLGVSCDWSRDSFTLDDNLSQAVTEVFVKMYEEDLIYKGERIVNWCPSCNTGISDAEVEHEERDSHLWHIKYPVKDSDEYIVIATTRPETMFGDLAVAVDASDERYERLVGKTLILPIVNREIPLITDEFVSKDFGTGAVKVTPSHDPNDFEIGARHDLGQCIVIDEDGKISEGYGKYSGMDRFIARKELIKELESIGALVKIEDHSHSVGHCERCSTIIEPLVSKQWFVKMEDLAKPAKEAYLNGDLTLIPDRFGKVYLNWLDNIRDWNISRQLWWGHRLPVYYCDSCGETIVARDKPDTCPSCSFTEFTQDSDTLDTWFSSALWPFSTLGWPEKTEDLDYFFPTDVLVTGYDIIFFWVIRMVFSSLHNMGELPFHHVYFTGLIRDEEGRKMSKSLDNGVDPIDVIEKYGADALRFTLITGNSPGNDMRYSEKRVEANRNFANKLWNASRFIFMNMEEGVDYNLSQAKLETEDKWVLSRINSLTKEVLHNLEKYEIGLAANALYDFIWFEFCDWYIELVKNRLYSDDADRKYAAMSSLLYSLDQILRLLHPFMPFITEEIYSLLPEREDLIIVAEYPEYREELNFQEDEKAVAIMVDAITAIRNQRSELNIANSKKINIAIFSDRSDIKEIFSQLSYNLESLAAVEEIDILEEDKEMENSITIVMDGYKIYISLDGLIDYEKELARLEKDREKTLGEIKRAEGKLSNDKFVSKAPEKLVNLEKEKLEKYKTMLEEIEESIQDTKSKL